MWKRKRSERDFSDEINAHLDIQTDQFVAEGMTADEARQKARRLFGNVTTRTEHFHESRQMAIVDAAWRNIRYAVRGLARRPAFAITAILTLAFGIGVNSALFTLLYSLLLRPPPVGDPSHLVNVLRDVSDNGSPYNLYVKGRSSMLSWPDYVRLREGTKSFENVAVYQTQSLSLDAGDRSVAIKGELASCNYFATVKVAIVRGRAFLPDECAANGAGNVVVLSYAHWQRRFGGDTSIIGRSLGINRRQLTVIGIAAQGFAGLGFDAIDAWVPVTMYPTLLPGSADDFNRDISWLSAIGRLRMRATPAGAAAELTTRARIEDANWPGRRSTIEIRSGARFFDEEDRMAVIASTTAAAIVGGLILLMCCANVMNLLLARAAARRREIGIRLSLGASRARLIVQLMFESGVLAFFGGGLGLILAWWLPPLIRATAPDQQLNLVLTPDIWVVGVTAIVALGAAAAFGIVPALQSTNLQLTAAMRGETGSDGHRARGSRWRNTAVIAQVSISALLLVTAAMFLRATQRSLTIKPGFSIAGVTTLQFDLAQARYDSLRARAFLTQVREQLLTSPGVQSVALAQMVPMRGRATMVVKADGVDGNSSVEIPTMFNSVSREYFETMEISLINGRIFEVNETGNPAPVVVSEAFAKRAWLGQNAIGRTITDNSRKLVVVGVASDIQSASLGTPDGPYFYQAAANADESFHVVVHASLSPAQMQELAAQVSAQLDRGVIVHVRSLADELESEVAPVKLASRIASAFGIIAMLLAAVGVYGIVAFAVSQRSREIGIRMALGATRRSVQGMMFGQGARVVGIGLVVGIVLSLGTSQAIRSMLFGLSPLDGVAFLGVAALLSIVASVAVAIPAARASNVDPVSSLRED